MKTLRERPTDMSAANAVALSPTVQAPALQLYPYQRRWVQDEARFKIAMFARQCGKTFTSTLELALDVMRAEAA